MIGRVARGAWHRKAKWMLKKVLIKPPTNATQMRNLCTSIIERRHGSSTSAAIVSTAITLWEDPNLVSALNSNHIYQSAKNRIQRTAYHILPNTTTSAATNLPSSLLQSANEVFKEVFVCPVCGKNLQCLHVSCNNSHKQQSSINEEDLEQEFLN